MPISRLIAVLRSIYLLTALTRAWSVLPGAHSGRKARRFFHFAEGSADFHGYWYKWGVGGALGVGSCCLLLHATWW